jgi:hypothetical protein
LNNSNIISDKKRLVELANEFSNNTNHQWQSIRTFPDNPLQFCKRWLKFHKQHRNTPSDNKFSTPSKNNNDFSNYKLNNGSDSETEINSFMFDAFMVEEIDNDKKISLDNKSPYSLATDSSSSGGMSIGTIIPGFTPLLMSSGIVTDSSSLDYYQIDDQLCDFINEDFFCLNSPLLNAQSSVEKNFCEPIKFKTPQLLSSSQPSSTGCTGCSIISVDSSPILQNSTTFHPKTAIESFGNTLFTPQQFESPETKNDIGDLFSSIFGLNSQSPALVFDEIPKEERNPDSLAKVCTELYTKMLSDEKILFGEVDAEDSNLKNSKDEGFVGKVIEYGDFIGSKSMFQKMFSKRCKSLINFDKSIFEDAKALQHELVSK